MGLVNFIRKHFRSVKEYRLEFLRYQRIRYHIVHNVPEDHKVVFACRLLRSTFTLALSEAVHDTKIILGLNSTQACWLGIQYGQGLHLTNTHEKRLNSTGYSFKLKKNLGRYQIRHVDRDGALCIIDRQTQRELIKDPREIAQSRHYIGEFDSVEACYIGILAGISSVQH
jgi:hypothetical protein